MRGSLAQLPQSRQRSIRQLREGAQELHATTPCGSMRTNPARACGSAPGAAVLVCAAQHPDIPGSKILCFRRADALRRRLTPSPLRYEDLCGGEPETPFLLLLVAHLAVRLPIDSVARSSLRIDIRQSIRVAQQQEGCSLFQLIFSYPRISLITTPSLAD